MVEGSQKSVKENSTSGINCGGLVVLGLGVPRWVRCGQAEGRAHSSMEVGVREQRRFC